MCFFFKTVCSPFKNSIVNSWTHVYEYIIFFSHKPKQDEIGFSMASRRNRQTRPNGFDWVLPDIQPSIFPAVFPINKVNTLMPRPNGRQFRSQHFQMDFLEWKLINWFKISLKFLTRVWINNIPSFVQIMVWRQLGDKTLSEPMMFSLLNHICTRPQWVDMRYWDGYDIKFIVLCDM